MRTQTTNPRIPVSLIQLITDKCRAISSFFTGRVQSPREENRIFLFLDLNDSTQLAERMGHVRYSAFLSSFFNDFQQCLKSSAGEVYQYVGDEVTVSWTYSERNMAASIRLVKQFRKLIAEKMFVYQREFGQVPQFKAAIHSGNVATTRIGTQKVYHGDILNTCSRLLAMASSLNLGLIIGSSLLNPVQNFDAGALQMLPSVRLRGKANPVMAYAISA